MISLVLRKKNAVLFFGVGFLIGIVLEITLMERGRLLAVYYNILRLTDGSHNPKLSCLVVLKHPTTETLEASERTWLRDCDEFFAVRVIRPRKNASTNGEEEEACERLRITNVTSNSAWGGLCKALLRAKASACDWFMISPDNLLVLVDNLKRFVSRFDSNGEHYLGHAIAHFDGDYNSLSAGVLISRGTLRKLLRKFNSDEECERSGKYWRNEDIFLGKHLKEMGIYPADTRDAAGRGRFHGYSINVLMKPGKLFKQSDYSKKAVYPAPEGLNCCSPDLITIDATNSIRMYHHYYYIYKLDRTGESSKIPDDSGQDGFDWREFLRVEGYNDSAIEKITADEYYQVWASKIPPESLYEMMRKEFGS